MICQSILPVHFTIWKMIDWQDWQDWQIARICRSFFRLSKFRSFSRIFAQIHIYLFNDFTFWSKNDDFSAWFAQILMRFVRRFGCFDRIFCSRPTIFKQWFQKTFNIFVFFLRQNSIFLKSLFKYSRPGAKNPGKTSKSSYKSH